jgi:hypothetical protein
MWNYDLPVVGLPRVLNLDAASLKESKNREPED